MCGRPSRSKIFFILKKSGGFSESPSFQGLKRLSSLTWWVDVWSRLQEGGGDGLGDPSPNDRAGTGIPGTLETGRRCRSAGECARGRGCAVGGRRARGAAGGCVRGAGAGDAPAAPTCGSRAPQEEPSLRRLC